MPTYVINGKEVTASKPLTDDEIDEIAASIPAPAAAPAPPQTEGLAGAARAAGIINRAVAPYATAQIAAPVIGPLALGATDLATGAYNLGARALGGQPMMTGSEAIRSLYPEAVFATPETPTERIASAGIEGAFGAGSVAKAFGGMANMLRPNTAPQNVMAAMAQQPGAQRAAGAAGAAAPQAMVESSEEGSPMRNPVLLAVTGGLASLAGGRAAMRGQEALSKTPSTEALYKEARGLYRSIDNAGVEVSSTAYDRLLTNMTARLQLEGYTDQAAIRSQLSKMGLFQGQNRSISSLDTTRSDISKTLLKSSDENVRRLGRVMADEIDDFISTATPADVTNAARLPQVQTDLIRARELWSKVSRSEQVEELVRRAKLSEQPFDTALRSEFRTLAKNERRFNRFTPEERQFILRVVEGGSVAKAMTELSEALRLRSLGGFMYIGAGGAALPIAQQAGFGADPATSALLIGGIAGGRQVLQAGANQLASVRAGQAGKAMRGFAPAPLFPLRVPALQNTLRAPYASDPEQDPLRNNSLRP